MPLKTKLVLSVNLNYEELLPLLGSGGMSFEGNNSSKGANEALYRVHG